MKTLLACALLSAGLAGPAVAAEACLRSSDIKSMQRVDAKTVRVETFGKSRPDFEIKFVNQCYGLQYGDPLVFTTLQSTQQCISKLDHVQVPNRGPCLIESITPIVETPKPST